MTDKKATTVLQFLLREIYHQFFVPDKWRYVIIFLISMYVISPVLGLLFPDIGTTLKKNNLNRADVTTFLQIDKNPIRIRPKNGIFTHLHMLTEKPFFFFYLYNANRMSQLDGHAATWWWHHWRSYAAPAIGCRITMTENTSFDLERFGISNAQASKLLLLHELRHCSENNVLLRDPFKRETDADEYTVLAMEKFDGDADFAQKFIHLRAMYVCDEDYNNSLYLDAVFNGKAPPDFEDIRTANNGFYEKFRQNRVEDFENMTALERRRAELFLASVKAQKERIPVTGKAPRVISSNRNCNVSQDLAPE